MAPKQIFRKLSVAPRRIARWVALWFPLRDSGPLAEPWRRIAAAMLDTLLLFPVSLAVVGRNFGVLNSASGNGPFILGCSIAVIAWLYVLAGWSLGPRRGCASSRFA